MTSGNSRPVVFVQHAANDDPDGQPRRYDIFLPWQLDGSDTDVRTALGIYDIKLLAMARDLGDRLCTVQMPERARASMELLVQALDEAFGEATVAVVFDDDISLAELGNVRLSGIEDVSCQLMLIDGFILATVSTLVPEAFMMQARLRLGQIDGVSGVTATGNRLALIVPSRDDSQSVGEPQALQPFIGWLKRQGWELLDVLTISSQPRGMLGDSGAYTVPPWTTTY